MENIFGALIMALLLSLSGCASNTYRIQSAPSEADVEMVLKNGTRKNVGKTPVNISANEVNPNNESFQLELKKDGFEKQSIFVQSSSFAKNVEVNVNLSVNQNVSEGKKTDASLNELASSVADIQKDIQGKNFDVAISKLNRMSAQYPTVATFYSLTGNVHYLERRFDKALASYKRALDLNPDSMELQKVIEKLQGLSGGVR